MSDLSKHPDQGEPLRSVVMTAGKARAVAKMWRAFDVWHRVEPLPEEMARVSIRRAVADELNRLIDGDD